MPSRLYINTPLYADVYGYRLCPSAEQFAWLEDRWFALMKLAPPKHTVASVASPATTNEGQSSQPTGGKKKTSQPVVTMLVKSLLRRILLTLLSLPRSMLLRHFWPQ